MLERIDQIRKTGNSVGGVVTCVARNVPSGLGAPVFDKLEAELAKACMSLPAAKGFEVGSGFEGTMLTGKEHNDEFYIDPETGATRTRTNRSGGIQGGISNGGETLVLVAPNSSAPVASNSSPRRNDHRQGLLQADLHHRTAAEHCDKGRAGGKPTPTA